MATVTGQPAPDAPRKSTRNVPRHDTATLVAGRTLMPDEIAQVPQGEAAPPTYLVPVAGPEVAPLTLDPSADLATTRGLLMGRHEQCTLRLQGADEVSRRHALFRFEAGGEQSRWIVTD
ncbi:MAG: FHA domain-containing protein, partial [Planctomycetota bacterium]